MHLRQHGTLLIFCTLPEAKYETFFFTKTLLCEKDKTYHAAASEADVWVGQ